MRLYNSNASSCLQLIERVTAVNTFVVVEHAGSLSDHSVNVKQDHRIGTVGTYKYVFTTFPDVRQMTVGVVALIYFMVPTLVVKNDVTGNGLMKSCLI